MITVDPVRDVLQRMPDSYIDRPVYTGVAYLVFLALLVALVVVRDK